MLCCPLFQDPEKAQVPGSNGSPGGLAGGHKGPDSLPCTQTLVPVSLPIWTMSRSQARRAWRSPSPAARGTPAPMHLPVREPSKEGLRGSPQGKTDNANWHRETPQRNQHIL